MNLNVFNATGAMHEKYDVSTPGGLTGRGEYKAHVRFGWSSRVLLDFVDKCWPSTESTVHCGRLWGSDMESLGVLADILDKYF